MEARFGYKRDKKCKWLTFIYLTAIAAIFLVLLLWMDGSYLRAWILALLSATLALYLLSIPRYVKVDDDFLEIHCVVEMTRIDLRDIVDIRLLSESETRGRYLCLLGSYGFFGYYGYYLDLREWDFVKVYATRRVGLILIEDIYEQRYLVSCRNPEALIKTTLEARTARLAEAGKGGSEGTCE